MQTTLRRNALTKETIVSSDFSGWLINDAFDIDLDTILIRKWIKELNIAVNKTHSGEIFLKEDMISRAMSYWYISIKIAKKWNLQSASNNHWLNIGGDSKVVNEGIKIESIYDELKMGLEKEKYSAETVKRYVGELYRKGLLVRHRGFDSGRVSPSPQLLTALANTQKDWVKRMRAMCYLIDKFARSTDLETNDPDTTNCHIQVIDNMTIKHVDADWYNAAEKDNFAVADRRFGIDMV